MVNQCLPIAKKIYIIDNASKYKPLIDYYQNELPKFKSIELIRHPVNGGNLIWLEYLNLFPDEYIVTDPDLLFNLDMPKNAISILSNIRKNLNLSAIGLALDISDHCDFTDAKFRGKSIYDWESPFWQNKIQFESEEVYIAPVDTTFALRSKSNIGKGSVRVAGKFTCKHIPWYRKEKCPLPVPAEEKAAFLQNNPISNWR